MMLSKSELRSKARANRVALASTLPDFAQAVAAHASALSLPRNSIVGGYVALSGEADPHLLLKHLAAKGHPIAFPRVVAKGEALSFHRWEEGQLLLPGSYGIPEPAAEWPVVEPRILLVPLLAFDTRGYRIGYGGGFYDRTLAGLAEKGETIAIGIAYAGQEIEHVPQDANDRRLDMVLTENGLGKFG